MGEASAANAEVQKHPVTAPEAVHAEMLTDEIGLLKVAMFPERSESMWRRTSIARMRLSAVVAVSSWICAGIPVEESGDSG